tara:strand:- start:31 stop:579 length:549 start_codon:yes stop_codon:yes gene_type:complete
MLKFKIRKKILKIRKNSKNKNIHIRFKHLYNLLSKTKNLKNKIVGGYYPINYEIDDLEILKKLEKKKIKISLPTIKKNFKMKFIKCSLNAPFKINKYGIPEPIKGREVYPDILLVPIVAFDKSLNRLGYGAGYYDRLIKSLKKKKKIITIGLAFDFQEFNSIPISKYDQKLDCIVTNKNILQ